MRFLKTSKKKDVGPDRSLCKIYSFYNEKINPEIPRYQKMVFDHFGFSINHVINNSITHGDFLTLISRSVTDADYLIIFDIDCIPIKSDWLQQLLPDLLTPRSITGAAQSANHLNGGQNLYVAPFFFAIATKYLAELNYPHMNQTIDLDAGQNLTNQIIKSGGKINFWWPTDIEEPKWTLHHPEHTQFGFGTTYNNQIYHAFSSRENISDNFIKKCMTIL